MKICCLGDSLTEGDYGVAGKRGIANIKKENYPYFLAERLQAEVLNFGKCGACASSYLKYYRGGNVNLKNADIILLMLGTNGGFDHDTETQGNADMRELIKLCQADAPQARLILCTPPHATENPAYSNCGYSAQVKKAVSFVRKLAGELSLPLIDLASCPAFTAENEPIMQPNDGLHFGKIGYQAMANFIAEHL